MNKALEVVFLFAVVLKITSTSDAENKTRTCFNAVNAIKQLVAPDKYDKAMRPCENGGPVLVRVGIYIVSINKVQESDMELDIQVYFRQTWKDPRLAYGKLNLSHESYIQFSPGYVWDSMWFPDPYFANEKSATLHTIMSKNQLLRLYPDGSVFFSSRLTLTLSCPMVFHDFPMDRQTCKMTFLSYGYSTNDVVYDWLTNKTETSVYWGQLELPQFSIGKIEIERRVDSYTVGDFTVLILHIHFHRRVEFYLTRNYIPAALVVMVTWLSFWVDRESAPARVGMGTTTILTMTTLLIGVGQQDLPVVSYMKALDWYYIGCFIFVFSGLCEFAMVNFFDASHRRHVNDLKIKASTSSVKETQEDLDVIPNGGIENYGFQYGMDLRPHGSPNECQESKIEEPKPSACFFHLSDRIENVARITFPLLFFIFNMVYWMRYRDSFIT